MKTVEVRIDDKVLVGTPEEVLQQMQVMQGTLRVEPIPNEKYIQEVTFRVKVFYGVDVFPTSDAQRFLQILDQLGMVKLKSERGEC